MDLFDLRCTEFNGPLVNFETKQYTFQTISEVLINTEKYKDFVVIDEHVADVIMRCNSHGIKTYYCCAGHPFTKHWTHYIDLEYSAYIAFERKPIIKHMFDNSKYWNVEESMLNADTVPSYTIRIKRNRRGFKDWCKAMKELRYKFSYLTNEFQEIYKD